MYKQNGVWPWDSSDVIAGRQESRCVENLPFAMKVATVSDTDRKRALISQLYEMGLYGFFLRVRMDAC